MFRRYVGALGVSFLTFGLLFSTACKPPYPRCNKDENCHEKGEVCVNGQCQECRDESQCDLRYPNEKRTCVDGRCEAKLECHLDTDCASVGMDLVCRNNKCVPECTQDSDCGSGRRCNAQKCVAECAQDTDCGPGHTCQSGTCILGEGGAGHISGECMPHGAGETVRLEMIHFEFNQYDLTPEARDALSQAVMCIKEAPQNLNIIVEGHCDDRGTQEYNLALGERRAQAVYKYLKTLGLDQVRLSMRTKGENEPLCNEPTEACYAQNRRAQFIQHIGN